MNEVFDLPVQYRGAEHLFPSRLEQTGYTHRFVVEVNGEELVFEPDEERNYRALADPEKLPAHLPIDLLKAIAQHIEALLR